MMGSRPEAGLSSTIIMQATFKNTFVSQALVSVLRRQIIDPVLLITPSHSIAPSYGESIISEDLFHICPE